MANPFLKLCAPHRLEGKLEDFSYHAQLTSNSLQSLNKKQNELSIAETDEPVSFRSQQSNTHATRTIKEKDSHGVQLDQLTREQFIRQSLNEIFPPKVTRDANEVMMVQEVSTEPLGSEAVAAMDYLLDTMIDETGAMRQGICAKRHNLHEQVFDELIRQETVTMPERGVLLKRVRDELQLVKKTYDELITSGGHYSLRKDILCKYSLEEVEQRVNEAQAEKEEVLAKVVQLKNQLESEERHQIEVRANVEKLRANEITFWSRMNDILQGHVKAFQDERKDMEKRKVNEEHLRRVRERKAKEAEEKAKAEEAEKAAMGSASGEDKPASENLDDEPNEEVMNKQERE